MLCRNRSSAVDMKATYENALKLLESRRRRARPNEQHASNGNTIYNAASDSSRAPNVRGTPSLVGMREWLLNIGHTDDDINRLNVIHIAGTKGKGSTSAFVRSFLQAHGERTGFPCKIGLYTSPDLRCIRERIQINNKSIDEATFAENFFEVWRKVSPPNQDTENAQERTPRFLQLLALTAFHTFIKEKTEAAIVETHHGGQYDATNVVQKPAVTGVTSIGMDHVAQLGPSVENIAWHKAGIFKTGTPAFSCEQEPNIIAVLQSRAEEIGVSLDIIPTNPLLPGDAKALQAPVQKINCSLALAVAGAYLERQKGRANESLTAEDISLGIQQFDWPGRFQTVQEKNNQWFLDGAHNDISVGQAAQWFVNNIKINNPAKPGNARILIFSHFSDERDGPALLERLARSFVDLSAVPSHVIFTTYQEREDGTSRADKSVKTPENMGLEELKTFSKLWRTIDDKASLTEVGSIKGALKLAREIGRQSGGMHTLITGSLHLVGGALNLLESSSNHSV